MANEPPYADPLVRWCGEGWRETGPYPMYAQHGRELMRCKSSVGEPTWFILSQYNY